MTDYLADAEEAYQRAMLDVQHCRELWQAEGAPIMVTSAGGQVYQHPLYKALLDTEKQAAALRRPLLPQNTGGGSKKGDRAEDKTAPPPRFS